MDQIGQNHHRQTESFECVCALAAKKDFEGYRDEAKAAGVEDMSVEQAVRAVEGAVRRACELCRDADELIDLGVPYPPDEFDFASLRDFMMAEQRRTRR
jgi:hypothetical protein